MRDTSRNWYRWRSGDRYKQTKVEIKRKIQVEADTGRAQVVESGRDGIIKSNKIIPFHLYGRHVATMLPKGPLQMAAITGK